jgi:hypothetical protein
LIARIKTISNRQANHVRLIYPETGDPYYIVAPSYIGTSAGVRALHLLCHSLNVSGRSAYLLPDPDSVRLPFRTHPELLTPCVTEDLVRWHLKQKKLPIVVYSEVISGNPYGAACVVRYVMNFPGLLGGDKSYAEDELCFGYSKSLAAASGFPENVLFLPAMETRIFKPPPSLQRRSGACFYADKYQKVHGGKLSDITWNCVEITRDEPGSQTPEQIAALFQRSELFFTYENTLLATEAVLCGCPAVFIPNPYLREIISVNELGMDGYAWGTDANEIARAKATVAQGAANYLRTFDIYWDDLTRFITLTQDHAAGRRGKPRACGADGIKLKKNSDSYRHFLSILPRPVEREIAKFLSTMGFSQLGALIWNDSLDQRGRDVRPDESIHRIVALLRSADPVD